MELTEDGKLRVRLDEPIVVDGIMHLILNGNPKTIKEPGNGVELLTEIEIEAQDYLNATRRR